MLPKTAKPRLKRRPKFQVSLRLPRWARSNQRIRYLAMHNETFKQCVLSARSDRDRKYLIQKAEYEVRVKRKRGTEERQWKFNYRLREPFSRKEVK